MRASARSSYLTRSRGRSSEPNRRHRTSVDCARGRCCRRRPRAAYGTVFAPFDDPRLPFAILYGFPLLAEAPDPYTLLGASIIVASTFYLRAARDNNRSRRACDHQRSTEGCSCRTVIETMT
jgi:hypothetical protein